MRKEQQFVVKARMPKDRKFGDFKITDINKKHETALADFGDGCETRISTEMIMPQISKYAASRKTFYVRAV